MQKIIIDIHSTQNLGAQYDKTELSTVGTLEQTDENYIIEYDEEQEPNEEPVHVTVTVARDESEVTMTRGGKYGSHLSIRRSSRALCNYGTPFGEILMGISGHDIEHEPSENGGEFNFRYDIDVNGSLVSRNKVKMIYRNTGAQQNVQNS